MSTLATLVILALTLHTNSAAAGESLAFPLVVQDAACFFPVPFLVYPVSL